MTKNEPAGTAIPEPEGRNWRGDVTMKAPESLTLASQNACPFGQGSQEPYRELGAKVWAKVAMLLMYLISIIYRKFLAARTVLGA
jgi:hypothetical protein